MSVLEIFLVGFGLAMDAFAVSLAVSMAADIEKKKLVAVPFVFAGFQMFMPILGDLTGSLFAGFISKYAPIAVFIILAIIGGNMIKEGVSHLKNPEYETRNLTWIMICAQGIATSIDAFAVGVGFRVTDTNILLAVGVIGLVTLITCGLAMVLGKKLGETWGGKSEIFGGVILCLIGIKSLFG